MQISLNSITIAFVLAVLTIGLSLLGSPLGLDKNSGYIQPVVVILGLFAIFVVELKRRLKLHLFGEIGFIYASFIVAYTVIPAFSFIADNLSSYDPLTWLNPASSALEAHLWRHVLYLLGFVLGYLLCRGGTPISKLVNSHLQNNDFAVVVFLAGACTICLYVVAGMSASVDTYWDHYTRYDHLSWPIRKLVSLCIRLKLGIYSVLLVFLFRNYVRYKITIPLVVCAICLHDLIYSRGARIDTFIILLQVALLYHISVRPLKLRSIAMLAIPAMFLFSFVEAFRVQGFNLDQTLDADISLVKLPSEFGAVFYAGYHLYDERAYGTLPTFEWPMLFNEFISVFTFGDFVRWNPMVWYAQNYFPDSTVPPFTLGPIAESALCGGEVNLAIRAIINGIFFAYIARWFIRHQYRWWGVCVYAYCYATCVLTLKYAVFFHLTPLIKTIVPVLSLVLVVKCIGRKNLGPYVEQHRPS